MGQLVIAAAGAAIGAWLPTVQMLPLWLARAAPSIGWAVGSIVGGSIFKTKLPTVYGPQLADTGITASTLGNAIPIGFGTFPAGGNIIWSSGWRQNARYTTVRSGKGGGGSKQTVVSYYYTGDFAVAICDCSVQGPITGVRKIWMAGRLIYDVGDDSALDSVLASTPELTIYTGTATQEPDSTIETALGAGNAPAFRGTAYVVFRNVLRENFGPVKFEVVRSGSIAAMAPADYYTISGYSDAQIMPPAGGGDEDGMYATAKLLDDGRVWLIYESYSTSKRRLSILDLYGQSETNILNDRSEAPRLYGRAVDGVSVWWSLGNNYDYRRTTPTGRTQSTLLESTGLPGTNWVGRIYEYYPNASEASLELYVEYHDVSPYVKGGTIARHYNVHNTFVTIDPGTADRTYYAGGRTELQVISTGATINAIFLNGGRIPDRLYISRKNTSPGFGYINLETQTYVHLISFANEPSRGVIDLDDNLYIQSGATNEANKILKYDSEGNLLDEVTLTVLSATGYGTIVSMVVDVNGVLYAEISGRLWKVDTATMAELATCAISAVTAQGLIGESTFNGNAPVLMVNQVSPARLAKLQMIDPFQRITVTAPTLASVVGEICSFSGIAGADLNTSNIASITVNGGVFTQQGSARQMLDAILPAYFVDATESDGKIKFISRGGASAVTIEENDLGAHASGEQAPDSLMSERQHELELPLEVNVAHLEKARDYDIAVQPSRRLVTDAKQIVVVNLPLVLTPSQAKQIADAWMYSAWTARAGPVEFSTTRKYVKYEPTDLVTLGTSRTVRIDQRDEGANGVIRFRGSIEDSSIYTQAAAGASGSGTAQSAAPIGPTYLTFMDSHLLRDADDDAGYYLGAQGVTDAWNGAVVYQSTDDGITYSVLANGVFTAASYVGYATTALEDPGTTELERFDEASSVTVYVKGYTPLNYTQEQVLRGNATPYALGNGAAWEIFYATTVSTVATDTYKLTGLLRGRKGTEGYAAGHAVGDTFVVLDEDLRSITQSFSDVGLVYHYKGVSAGSTLQRTGARTFVNSAARKKPLAPWQLRMGRRDASGELLLQWTRRTRYENPWRDGADAPLGEALEQYYVEILNGATVVRSAYVTTPEYIYTVANQTTDFGGAQTTLTWRVYQVSSEFGLGYVANATLTVPT